jgi:SMC interacting uncharacterized protein involved in chromosome segregation
MQTEIAELQEKVDHLTTIIMELNGVLLPNKLNRGGLLKDLENIEANVKIVDKKVEDSKNELRVEIASLAKDVVDLKKWQSEIKNYYKASAWIIGTVLGFASLTIMVLEIITFFKSSHNGR